MGLMASQSKENPLCGEHPAASGIAILATSPQRPRVTQPYLSLEAEWHDAFWHAEDDDSELPLMLGFLEQFPGKALEIGSGSGRLMLPLLDRGFDVEGLELSADMRALAFERAQALGVQMTVHEGDMCQWRPEQAYHSLLAPAFTIQLASDPLATLLHWNQMLLPGGGLYLTTFIPYTELLGELPENTWYPDRQITLGDGRSGRVKTRHQLDHDRQILHREHRYSITKEPKTRHESRQDIRWIEHSEMLAVLTQSGFELSRYCLDFDPAHVVENPDHEDFDGILTYFARKTSSPPP